jgi:hypothetical protein
MAAIAGTRKTHASVETLGEPEPLHDGSDRYRIYVMVPDPDTVLFKLKQQQIADTDLQGIGPTLSTLREEGQITNEDRVGIRDRVERKWFVNPHAIGRRTRGG